MRRRGRSAWLLHRLRAGFWFVPGGMAAVAFLAAAAALSADAAGVSAALRPLGVPFDIGRDAAQDLLSTLAGAMVTVVSLVFSLTLVTLTVAAGNLGARLLERYMQNRVTQVTMGLFVGTFVFTVLVLSAVGAEPDAVPRLSVVLALVLSIVSVVWLMYAFHDLARSLQIDQAAAEIAGSLRRRIAATSRREGDPAGADEPLPGSRRKAVHAAGTGYVEAIDWDALGTLARGAGVALDVTVAQGAYVTPVDELAVVYGGGGVDAALEDAIRAAIAVGELRTEADDLMFLVHLLVEIACRALSPGVNDVYTALACVDHLTGAMVLALDVDLQPVAVRDGDGRLLVRTRSACVDRMAATVLATLRRNGAANTTFALRLLRNLERLGRAAAGRPIATALREHLDRVAAHAVETASAVDRPAIEAAAARARAAFGPVVADGN